jgi:hypothetical protein
VALHTLLGERQQGTDQTIQTMPLNYSYPLFEKVLLGLATLIVPIEVAEGACFLVFRQHPTRNLLMTSISDVALAATLYLWTIAFASRVRSQLVIVVAPLMILALAMIVGTLFHAIVGFDLYLHELLTPCIWVRQGDSIPATYRTGRAILQLLISIALVAIPLMRSNRRPRHAPMRIVWAYRKPLRWNALRFPILWKTIREIRWLLLASTGISCLLLIFQAISLSQAPDSLTIGFHGIPILTLLLMGVPALTAILLGTEIGIRDAERQTDQFLASTPLPPKQCANHFENLSLK